jgi:hypothetical protein
MGQQHRAERKTDTTSASRRLQNIPPLPLISTTIDRIDTAPTKNKSASG